MFFTSYIQIDPSQETVIKPKDGRFIVMLSNLLSNNQENKLEQETFSAISILEEIKEGLNNIGVSNIIKLSVDNFDYYFDSLSKDNDLEDAFANLKCRIDPVNAKLFDKIHIALEHKENRIKYYIDIAIQRKHKVKEFPIKINIFGLFSDFSLTHLVSDTAIKKELEKLFESKLDYQDFVDNRKKSYDEFIAKFLNSIKKFLKIDADKIVTNSALIRSNSVNYTIEEIKNKGLFTKNEYSYNGMLDYILYLWYWCAFLAEKDVNLGDFILFDENGKRILSVGRVALSLKNHPAISPALQFYPIKGAYVKYFKNSMFSDILKGHKLIE